MTLSEELTWRGFVNQTTFKDITVLDGEPINFYWGCDPSSDSLTIGNLAAAMMARVFMSHGHKATMLVGGATGMIGDPKDDDERVLSSLETVATNKAAIAAQYERIFSGQAFELVDNYDWFKDIGYLQFLRDIGKHFSMSQMLDREFVKARVGEGRSGLSYAEFSYSLIQGYDFLTLFRDRGVTLQLCGADQWGNSLSGVELIRKLEGAEAHVWSIPLIINKTTGKKFGKSEDGAVWLDEHKTSVYTFYQFWLNVDDAGVIDYLKVYTMLPKDEIEKLEQTTSENAGARVAQKVLAHEVTKLIHGADRTASVERVTEVLFGGRDIHELSDDDLDALAGEIPTTSVGKSLIETLVLTGLSASNGEARRLLQENAISVNGVKPSDNVTLEGVSLLKKGKNAFALAR